MEACYLLGKYLGAQAEINLVEALAAGDLSQADVPEDDLARMLSRCASTRASRWTWRMRR